MASRVIIKIECVLPVPYGELLLDERTVQNDSQGFDHAIEWLRMLREKYHEVYGYEKVKKEAESGTKVE